MSATNELTNELQAYAPEIQPRKTRWTIAELYDTEFPEQKWIVPEIFTEGLTMLAGRPKVGKSWLALQIAAAVSTGGKVFNKDILPGRVLYYALEDSPRRLKDRISKLQIPRDAKITILQETRPLQGRGYDDLGAEIMDGGYSYVVLDTLTRALPGVDQNEQRIISPIMAKLQTMAHEQNCCLLLIDHHRKPNGINPDEIDDALGSTAKTAVCDEIAGIFKRQGVMGASFKATGRDIEPIDLRIMFDHETACWQLLGESSELEINDRESEILAALDEGGKLPLMSLAKFTGQDKGNLYRRLADMVNRGVIAQPEFIEGKKHYFRGNI